MEDITAAVDDVTASPSRACDNMPLNSRQNVLNTRLVTCPYLDAQLELGTVPLHHLRGDARGGDGGEDGVAAAGLQGLNLSILCGMSLRVR